ncbi:aromatic ring-hydroxylating dioxygenase subunit alpha [Sphaerisporangium sp. TRM90804]|uniref:aromatic ring-hydroxylating oxygenase subunit alpha n=1 Tax=Sphaerisporangium sp. TRM90804 TaxID=3031113 RepID=UPI002449E601|nr:aromatic ring-hydroxylating dioxygenase subunit alpha [Sphaerisporangium sp. TRM90804]MDH2428341.1 aromatic ring-hydroxylating dioxygenase subunit alpha [Sphaerisporangium sp. TRM90804]
MTAVVPNGMAPAPVPAAPGTASGAFPDGVPSPELAGLLAEMARYLEDDPPALSLPPRAFLSPELYELERRRVFGRSWVLVAHVDDVSKPGDYLALTVAEEPVVVVRGSDGVLRGLSPVCRHRLMPVVAPGSGTTDAFTCPYHLWRYGLDGALVEAAYMDGNPAFDPASCRLPAFSVEEWNGFVFVNLDPVAAPLAPHMRQAGRDLECYPLGQMVQVATWVHQWGVNWKLAAQNVYENYHVTGLHGNTIAQITPPGADTDVRVDSPWVTCLRTPLNAPLEASAVDLPEDVKRYMYHWAVFPYGSLQAFADAIIWLSVIPTAVDRTEVRGGVLLPAELVAGADREALRRNALLTPDIVNADDKQALEAVQAVLGSRHAERGHLSPKEPGVQVFYRNLAAALLARH